MATRDESYSNEDALRTLVSQHSREVTRALVQYGDVKDLVSWLVQYADIGELGRSLAASDGGLSVAQSAVVTRRRELVAKLQSLIKDPAKTETDIQRLIGDAYWIFGGRYVGVAKRHLMSLDEYDILLLGADETLHIVELKGPNIPVLVRFHRNHWIVGNAVHEAVGQAMNYVRAFDELGASQSTYYQNELGQQYDMRRVFATVVIGYPTHVRATDRDLQAVDERTIQQTIRSYNAHLSRIEVMTYKDVADTAERALAFENEAATASSLEQQASERPED